MLRINQRIKKVRGTANIGATGIFIGLPDEDTPLSCDGRAVLDADTVNLAPSTNKVVKAGDPTNIICAEWEPIVPDGMQPAEWESCLWQPPMKAKSKDLVVP